MFTQIYLKGVKPVMVLLKHSQISTLTSAFLAVFMCVINVNVCKLEGSDIITHNQIEFQKLLETKRANKRQEALTEARDLATREYQSQTVSLGHRNAAETERSNRAREQFNLLSLNEQQRHNLITESISKSQLTETARSNRAKELETARSNRARETETNRSNTVNEWLSNQRNIELNRSNLENERLRRDQNTETNRANLANEAIRSESNFISLNSMYETARANRAREAYQLADLAQSKELKERELADRYFWEDKLNQALEAFLGTSNLGGFVSEKGEKALRKGAAAAQVIKSITQPEKTAAERVLGLREQIEKLRRISRI